MTEGATNVEFVAAAMPERKEEMNPAVRIVKGALSSWWERVGPGSVEKSWVAAHRNILKHIDGEERQQAFDQSAETWRRIGKALGYTSTALDFGIGGLGMVLSIRGWRNPRRVEGALYSVLRFVGSTPRTALIHNFYHGLVPRDDSLVGEALQQILPRRERVGRGASVVTGIGSLGVLSGLGPAHALSRLAAGVAGKAGEVGAHTGNYVASGKASEHAKKVGGALGKGATAAVTYAAEHPDEIRKTMRTVEEIRKDREQERVLQETSRRQEAQRAFERRYQDWVQGMDPNLKAYYRDSHITPSHEEYMKQTGDKGAVVER